MTAISSLPPRHRFPIVERIRDLFERSPGLCGAQISDPRSILGGQVSVDVGFGRGPAMFRIVAPSAERAYALLYELARALVGNDVTRPGRGLDGGA